MHAPHEIRSSLVSIRIPPRKYMKKDIGEHRSYNNEYNQSIQKFSAVGNEVKPQYPIYYILDDHVLVEFYFMLSTAFTISGREAIMN